MKNNTSLISKIVFWPLTIISMAMTIALFYNFGTTIVSSIEMAILAFGFEGLKIVALTRWIALSKSKKDTDKRKSSLFRALYIGVAICSAFASLTFGITEIDKAMAKNISGNAGAYAIQQKIDICESQLSTISRTDDDEYNKQLIRKQIERLEASMTNLTYNIEERSIRIVREIDRLKSELNNSSLSARKTKLIDELASLKESLTNTSSLGSTQNQFQIFASTINANYKTVMVIFLLFVMLIIEIGMAVTSFEALIKRNHPSKRKENKINVLDNN